MAKEVAPSKAEELVDISAQESLEWYKDKRLYVARGQAKAIKGDMTIEADLLTAHQRDVSAQASPDKTGTKPSQIDVMTAEGHVIIQDPKQKVLGDKAVYDFDRKTLTVTGGNLKYITDKNIVTAKDSLEYDGNTRQAIARGRAIGENDGNRVEADEMIAHFVTAANGQTEMTQMVAHGHVTIMTKDGALSRGDEAVYDTKKNIATLEKNVRITRGQAQLAGDKAEVDFTTGQHRLINSGGGRVRALLPASSEKKKGTP